MTRADDDTAVTAAILAGGQARRMGGTDKSALEIGSERIIDRQIEALRQVAASIIVVGADPARCIAARGAGIEVVPDVITGCGAIGGIYTALTASRHARTLVVACDMPFLSATLLRRLVQPFSSPEVDVLMPRTHEGLQPLCAVYATRCAEALRRRIDRGLLKAADVSESVRVEEIGPAELATYDPDGLMFVNVNTPHDYERAKDLLNRAPGSRAKMAHRITDVTR